MEAYISIEVLQTWTKYTFAEVSTADADLYYKDLIQVLTSLFAAVENEKNFKVGPTCNCTEWRVNL